MRKATPGERLSRAASGTRACRPAKTDAAAANSHLRVDHRGAPRIGTVRGRGLGGDRHAAVRAGSEVIRTHRATGRDSTLSAGGRDGSGAWRDFGERDELDRDRKSTRLNSSHVAISYAVFC